MYFLVFSYSFVIQVLWGKEHHPPETVSTYKELSVFFMGLTYCMDKEATVGWVTVFYSFFILLAISCPCLCCMWEREEHFHMICGMNEWKSEKCEDANKWFSPPSKVNVSTFLLQFSIPAASPVLVVTRLLDITSTRSRSSSSQVGWESRCFFFFSQCY